MKLGIDFGTTRTVVACADRGNYPITSFFDEAGDAHEFYPSVIAERAGELRFGWDALACASDASWTLVRSFKRMLGGRAAQDDAVKIGDSTLLLRDVIYQFLVALKLALETRSNLADAFARERGADVGALADVVDDATAVLQSVVAVPANASGLARLVTLDAFRRAGLMPVAMLNEPSAAGLEYTHRHRDTFTEKREHVVVYDLGGGTFDASLVRMKKRKHEILQTAGKNQLGGDDFDDVLVDLVLESAGLDRSAITARALDHLRVQCRDAKEALNPSSHKMTIDLGACLTADDAASDRVSPSTRSVRDDLVVVSVAAFYERAKPLVLESIEAMVPVMTGLESATSEDVDRALADIAGIYVVGGGSELPIVARALRERFGRRVHRSPYPSAAIAIGLAIACDEAAGFELHDRFTRTFGVFREGRAGAEITFDPIFTHATELPSRAKEPLVFRRSYRAAHNLGHFRFVECSVIGEDGRPRGDMMLSGDVYFPFASELRAQGAGLANVAVMRAANGPRIEEEYSLDENGLVAVTIRDLDSGFSCEHRLGGAA